MVKQFDREHYAALARQATAEGAVLLKNDAHALPLERGARVAVFGRCQLHYYKSGIGSGGLVNAPYMVSILDALRASKELRLDNEVMRVYEDWQREHPPEDCREWGWSPGIRRKCPCRRRWYGTRPVLVMRLSSSLGERPERTGITLPWREAIC